MRERRILIWGSILIFSMLLPCLAEKEPEPGLSLRPVTEIMNPDGTLNLKKGLEGSFDPRGYRMMTQPGGAPRFVPSSITRASSGEGKIITAASIGYWDDQIGDPGMEFVENGKVNAVAVSGTTLYAGGFFAKAGGVTVSNIAKWDGTSWSALGTGIDQADQAVYTLAVSGTTLYAGGSFMTAGGVTVNRIAKWDGSSWSALGTGMTDAVYALAASGTTLYAGGIFTTAGGVTVNKIAKWDGSSWSALGTGMEDPADAVYALAVSGTTLYAGGSFTSAGGTSANRIARWDGTSWYALGTGMEDPIDAVHALAVSGTTLYAGGSFASAGGVTVSNIAMWDGTSWYALGLGADSTVYTLAMSGTTLYAGGFFTAVGAVDNIVNRVAEWDGTSWSALGTGMNNGVWSLALSGPDLYVGGQFTTAGAEVSSYIACWHTPVTLNAPVLDSPGNGATGQALTLNLHWEDTNSSPQEQEYEVRIKPDGGSYTNYEIDQDGTTQQISLPSTDTIYYWNVRAIGEGLYVLDSSWANSGTDWSFRTTTQLPSTTITTSPAGLQITVDSTSYTSPHVFQWAPSSSHTISVGSPQSPSAGTRYVYSSWSDAGIQTHTITGPFVSTTYTATFTTQYSLTSSASPLAGGTVTPSGTNWYNSATLVQPIQATAAASYSFASWSGDLSGTTNPTSLTMNGPKSVTANFAVVIPSYTLTIQSTPDVGASITVSPNDNSGHGNGNTNFTRTYNTGTTVTLTAPSTLAGKNFAKWTIDGTDNTNISIQVSMGAIHTVVAVYINPETAYVYGFNENSGTSFTDANGSGNNGTLYGAAAWLPSEVKDKNGAIGTAITYNGTNSYARLASHPLMNGPFSIMLWAKRMGSGSGATNPLIQTGAPGSNQGYKICWQNDNSIRASVFTTGIDSSLVYPSAATNQWTHIALSYDQTAAKLYINGQLIQQAAQTGWLNIPNWNFSIGGQGGGTDDSYFNGIIDGLKVYSKALTGAETSAIYQSEKPKGAAVLNAPILLAPSSGAINQPTSLTLQWQDTNLAPQEAKCQVRIKPAGGAYIFFNKVQNAISFLVSNRVPGKTYFWNVRAKGNGGSTKDSSWAQGGVDWSFAVAPPSILNAPTLVSPADNAIDQPTSVLLHWLDTNSGPQETKYQIRIKPEGGVYANFIRPQDAASYIITGRAKNKIYYWSVRARGNGTSTGNSPWANSGIDWKFTTKK